LWGLAGQANASLYLGETDLSIQLSEQALAMSEGISDQGFFINRYGMLSLAHLRKGNAKQAVDYAKQSLDLIRKSGRPTIPSYIDGYVCSIETLFTLWDTKNYTAITEQELAELCTDALKLLRKYSGIFALGIPYMHKYEGWNAWLSTNPSQAALSWAESLSIFTQRGYVYEQAAIQQLMSTHS
jgi:hypothetical protein